jgi:Flp pilus assembly protein TadG
MIRRRQRDGRESGVALVEFALVLPFMAIIAFGTIDLGRAYLMWIEVKNVAREGANYAQLHPYSQQPASGACTDPDNVRYRARSETGDADASSIAIAVTPATPNGTGCDVNATPPAAGTSVTVTASRSFTLFTPLVSGITGPITVRAAVTEAAQG